MLAVIKQNACGSNLKIFLIKLLFTLSIFCWLLSNKMLVGVIWKYFCQVIVPFVNFSSVVIKQNARGSNLKIFLIKLLFTLSIFCWLLSNKMLMGVIWKFFLSSYCLLCQFFVGCYQTKCSWESSKNIFCQVIVRFVNFLSVVIKQNTCGSNLKIFLIKLLFALLIFCWL